MVEARARASGAIRATLAGALALIAIACSPTSAGPLCLEMAARCGGAHAAQWQAWCESDCVPDVARTQRCEANAQCLLCDAPRADTQTIYFGLPNELEYLWTVVAGPAQDLDPAPVGTASGAAFDDAPGAWSTGATSVGAWRRYQPYDVTPFSPEGYCEPGPNQFLALNVSAESAEVVLRAERTTDALFCDAPSCPAGPYPDCAEPSISACQYHDAPETRGVGTAAQLDRALASGELATYGYGRYRSVHAAGTDAVGPSPGFNYAFFLQSNAYCVAGSANPESNTGEIDIEISSGTGSIFEAGPYCTERDMCFQLVNWVSSSQGLANAAPERRETSGFRFREPALAGNLHTWGFDWAPDDVRFTYDSDPSDCDEHAGSCAPDRASVVICRHTSFVPRRPAELHLQLWNAFWAGLAPGGRVANMRVAHVWHEPR